MSNEHTNGVIAGLREAGVIADRIADELEFSRCQQVATRIRHEIVQAIRSHESAPAPRVSQPHPKSCQCNEPSANPLHHAYVCPLYKAAMLAASPGTPEGPRCQTWCGRPGRPNDGRRSDTVAWLYQGRYYCTIPCRDSARPLHPGTPSTPGGSL